MQYLNIAGYKFISLSDLSILKDNLESNCAGKNIKGTILLSKEGINICLAGAEKDITNFLALLANLPEFADISFKQSYSKSLPFKRFKIKIKDEIITFKRPEIDATTQRANSISPKQLKQWLDDKHDFTLLDTRNDYEIEYGTFSQATHLNLSDFSQLPDAISQLNKEKTIVMFCTGGIRCEKAALYMQEQGYKNVYQLDGGILNYFAQVGGAHYEGSCFVFDDRIAVDSELREMD